jgi:parallel beta-helix repeat protein
LSDCHPTCQERSTAALRRCLYACLVAAGLSFSAEAAVPPGYAASLAVYQPQTNHLFAYADLATKSFALDGIFGGSGDIPVAGDFDGNGVADFAVFRAGTWYIDLDHNFSAETSMTFGAAGDIPLAADFDGDGKSDLVVFRSGTWYIRSSATGQSTKRSLGQAGDQPVVADFNGDDIPDLAVYRHGTWYIQTVSTSGADIVDHFGGLATDKACAMDWNRDGRADLCVYRDGIWYFHSIGAAGLLDSYAMGTAGDIPLPGGAFDYNGAIYVRAGATGTPDGGAAHPFPTIQQAFDAAVDGSVIRVAGGNYAENVVLFGPMINYAPGKYGKNNIKLIGASQRAVKLLPPSGDAIKLQGSTGNVLQQFNIGSANSRGVVLVGGAGSVNPSVPGSTLSMSLVTITETLSYGVLVTGASNADIRYCRVNRSMTKSGIGTQGGAPTATIAYNELAQNGYTLASGADGNGVEAQSSSSLTVVGNQIHDNNRFGIIGVGDSKLAISANAVVANRLNGIILCAAAGDTSTAQIVGNWISGNGVDNQNGRTYNGIEFNVTCVGSQTVTGNTIQNNSGHGIFLGSGTANISNNTLSNNTNGVYAYAGSLASANTLVSLSGNVFTDNLHDGVFAAIDANSPHSLTASVGGTQSGQANSFSGQGFHGIGCAGSPLKVTCPSGGNTFSNNVDDIEFTCPATCVK